MPDRSRFAVLLPLAALAAGASLPASSVASGTIGRVPSAASGESAYGLFLAGQSAINSGLGDLATIYFSRAANAADIPDISLLNGHTFTAALLAGDVKSASAYVPGASEQDASLHHLAGLTRAVEAMAEGDGAKARAILQSKDVGPPHSAAAALLTPFAAAEAGDNEAAIAHPVIADDRVASFFASLDQGKLFERAHRYDEAETAFRALIASGDPGGLASINLGALLERRGRFADAAAIYDQALTRIPGDQNLLDAKARAAKGEATPLPSLRESASEALIAPASILLIQKQEEVALVYLRLALRLDPTRDTAWVLVGDILADAGDIEGAHKAYLTPKAGSPEFVSARSKLAWSYQSEGKKDEALRTGYDILAAAPQSREAATTMADLLRANERYADSAKVLDKLIAREGATADWRLLYMRAVDFQESDQWADAERDLTAALKRRPDEPELLNFLGYSWIDRGEKLHEALAMVQKAVNADPKSGAMLDSLGWGYYRLGDYQTAVDKLESAVAIEAGDPDVNSHLGDAYWKVGRKVEARFQWNRVLTLEPTAKMKSEVEAKLKAGLDPTVAMSGS
ncbi:MAG TPA: tetratricopeptide repeat protein [Caulobacteraceae bacterium]|jgi:Flp pilus assembly protein TadD|nr:tetratricopeptide repeat protein [Caulobacteraceae bacterium]